MKNSTFPKAIAHSHPLSPVGISNPLFLFSFRGSCLKYLPRQLFVLILASTTSRCGRKLDSPGCLHLVGPALCCSDLDWDLDLGDTWRGRPCRAQLTGSHLPRELRDLAKTARRSPRPSILGRSLQL